ncbi:DUF3631 domain-containing protein [Silvimonas amylolytica]|uniref:DUF3631 domain-containing protein n=1 Tax=Silvimonas amylolytica TaxID=449663 RepID=A0ABQ2PHW9_9NEIS|nr:DUF3631 domain-containing protein [Silvimonas amylolytica]GGP24831.1 hypothetical protein GCM10010971_06500 [Silvimonas amylolytica]
MDKLEHLLAALPDVADEEPFLQHLATLSKLDYSRIRGSAAKMLGVKLSMLDETVADYRKQSATPTKDAQGQTYVPKDVAPWSDTVDGTVLLDSVLATLHRYVVADVETLWAATLWLVLTWLADYATVLPLALITAPEKGCGKTTLLSVFLKLARRAVPAANITPAALFWVVDTCQPTLLIDEADTFMKGLPDLVGIINSGHTRDTSFILRVLRVDGDNFGLRHFCTFGPKAISGIGAHRVADSLTSRSILLPLRRKLPDEQCENIRHADTAGFNELKRKLARWAQDNGPTFGTLHPSFGHNRTNDNWEPLLAIAELAGPAWKRRAHQAAIKLTDSAENTASINQQLLADIQSIFVHTKADRIHTVTLRKALCEVDGPWSIYNSGQPITAHQLGTHLREFGITSNTVRVGDLTLKGYKREQFDDAFKRYLPVVPPSPVTPSQTAANKASNTLVNRHTETNVTEEKPLNTSDHAGCDVVTSAHPGDENNDWSVVI